MKAIEERIWPKVKKAGSEDCWPWTGKQKAMRGEEPYGRISVRYGPRKEGRAKHFYVHRLVYELTHGTIPKGKIVRHLCNNTLCCNPRHLMAGTNQDNMNDMIKSGRSLVGSKQPRSKLTWSKVRQIRSLRKRGWTLKRIAEKYNVHLASVGLICQGKTWKVGGEDCG